MLWRSSLIGGHFAFMPGWICKFWVWVHYLTVPVYVYWGSRYSRFMVRSSVIPVENGFCFGKSRLWATEVCLKQGERLPAGPATGLLPPPSNHREISLFICGWNYYFTQLAHSLLYRGQVWFQLMLTFLSSPLALPLEWRQTRGAELPTVLDKECLQDSCLTHVSPRRDHRASALTPKSQRRNPMSWHPPLPSNDRMAWYLEPPCLALSTFHSHL